MTIADWLMILAVLSGPVVAVRLTRYLDNQKEIRERKVNVFKTLMATRAYTISWSQKRKWKENGVRSNITTPALTTL